MRVKSQANVDIGIFQETKVAAVIYTWESSGYRIVALESPSTHIGGVAIFYHTVEHFCLEVLQLHGANSARF